MSSPYSWAHILGVLLFLEVEDSRSSSIHRNGIMESKLKGEQDREDLKKKLESEVRRLEIQQGCR